MTSLGKINELVKCIQRRRVLITPVDGIGIIPLPSKVPYMSIEIFPEEVVCVSYLGLNDRGNDILWNLIRLEQLFACKFIHTLCTSTSSDSIREELVIRNISYQESSRIRTVSASLSDQSVLRVPGRLERVEESFAGSACQTRVAEYLGPELGFRPL